MSILFFFLNTKGGSIFYKFFFNQFPFFLGKYPVSSAFFLQAKQEEISTNQQEGTFQFDSSRVHQSHWSRIYVSIATNSYLPIALVLDSCFHDKNLIWKAFLCVLHKLHSLLPPKKKNENRFLSKINTKRLLTFFFMDSEYICVGGRIVYILIPRNKQE